MDNNQTIDFIELVKTLQVAKYELSELSGEKLLGGYVDRYEVFCGLDHTPISYKIFACTIFDPSDYYPYNLYSNKFGNQTQTAAKKLEYRMTCNIIKKKINNTPINSEDLIILGKKKAALLEYRGCWLGSFNYQNFVSHEEMISEIARIKTEKEQYMLARENEEKLEEQKRLERKIEEEEERLNREWNREQTRLEREKEEEAVRLIKERKRLERERIKEQVNEVVFDPIIRAYENHKTQKENLKREEEDRKRKEEDRKRREDIKDTRDL